MDRQSIGKQLQVEQTLIAHIVGSLSSALDWKTEASNASRKLSTLRFVAEMFHRHLERLMAIHEYDGYMIYVSQSCPHLASAIAVLKNDHENLREELNRVIAQLDRVSADDPEAMDDVCGHMRAVLDTFHKHSEMETELLQESILREDGGRG